jgi:hypothetical protein
MVVPSPSETNLMLRNSIKDPVLKNELEALWQKAIPLQDFQTGKTDQSHSHCLRVESNIWSLIHKDIRKFKDIDLFVLSASAALHDLAKIKKDETKDHGEEVSRWLLHGERWKTLFTEKAKAEAVANIIGVHSNGKIDDLQEEFVIGNPPGILQRSLAAIFRLADMLDSDYRRCPYLVKSFKKLKLHKDIITWTGRSSITGWRISEDGEDIVLQASPENENEKIKTLAYLDSLNESFTESQKKHLTNCSVQYWENGKLQKETLSFPCRFKLEIKGKIMEGLIHLYKEIAHQYASRVAEIFSDVDLKGIGDFSEKSTTKLSHVFVDVKVTMYSGLAPENYEQFDDKVVAIIRRNLSNTSMPVTYIINMEKLNKIILLGEPGSGKTTICQYICLKKAEDAKETVKKSKDNSDSDINGISFLVTIREYVSRRKKKSDLTVLDYLYGHVRSFLGYSPPEGFVEFWLANERTIVFFDGLDEVIETEDRRQIRDVIANFVKEFPCAKYVVTSRIVGYEESSLDRNTFLHLLLLTLENDQIEIFIRRWYEEREPNPTFREHAINSFLEALKETHVRELAHNPLLLTIMALVHGAEADLPKQRALLYRKCVEAFLINRNKAKDLLFYDVDEAKRCHDYLGYLMHEQAEKNSPEMTSEELRKCLAKILETDEKIEQFMSAARARVGLLVERGRGVWSFGHRSFEEYFAARYISQTTFGIENLWRTIKDKIGRPHWIEVLKLLAGIYDDTNKQALYEYVEKLLKEDTPKDLNHSKLILAGEIIGDKVALKENLLYEITDKIIEVFLETKDPALMNRCKMVLDHLFKTRVEKYMIEKLKRTDPLLYPSSAFQEIYRSQQKGDTRIDRLIGMMGTLRS